MQEKFCCLADCLYICVSSPQREAGAHPVDKVWITFLKKDSKKFGSLAERFYICYVIKKRVMRIRRIVSVSDNQLKANELRNRISESFSDDFSRTSKSRLIGVSKCGRWAFTQETEGEYEFLFEPGIDIQKRPVAAIHTAFFGI